MTKLVDDPNSFMDLHFKNDLTHVSFFSRMTFNYLADRDGLAVNFIGDRVILLKKNQKGLPYSTAP